MLTDIDPHQCTRCDRRFTPGAAVYLYRERYQTLFVFCRMCVAYLTLPPGGVLVACVFGGPASDEAEETDAALHRPDVE